MIILLHVLIALTSIVTSAYVLFKPSKKAFTTAYSLIAATLASGTYLVISTHSSLTHSCFAGLTYLAVVVGILIPARKRFNTLATQKNQ